MLWAWSLQEEKVGDFPRVGERSYKVSQHPYGPVLFIEPTSVITVLY